MARRFPTALLFLLPTLGCGPKAQVKSFDVSPPLVCAGRPVQVQWDVVGKASLREQPSGGEPVEQQVASTGTKTVNPASTTTFTITALDANRAVGNWQGNKTVQVASLPDDKPRIASAPCDPGSRKCTGTFVIDAPDTARVAHVSLPTVTRAGVDQKATIEVTHGTWRQKVAPDQDVPVDLPAAGPWTLDVDLGPNDAPTPPPRLGVKLDFACH